MGQRIKIAIAGINGRMGRASARAIIDDQQLQLVGAFGKPDAPYSGQDIGLLVQTSPAGILVSNGISEILTGTNPDVLLDFSQAEASCVHAKLCIDKQIHFVIGASGLSEKEISELSDLTSQSRLGAMVVPNFSVGAVLMMEFARQAGAFYSNAEIVEMHHTKKLDAPSGTAMHTAAKLAAAGHSYNTQEVAEKELVKGARGAQMESGVRIHSLRLPGLISHQEVIFGSAGELLTIRHDSFNTDCFVKGILMSVKAVMELDRLMVGLDKLLFTGHRQEKK